MHLKSTLIFLIILVYPCKDENGPESVLNLDPAAATSTKIKVVSDKTTSHSSTLVAPESKKNSTSVTSVDENINLSQNNKV